MSNLTLLIAAPLGIIGFLFLFWKRLKEDYTKDIIFSSGFIIVGSILLGFFLGNFISITYNLKTNIFSSRGLWFWLAFIFGSIGFLISFYRYKLRFFESLEGASLGFLFFIFCASITSALLIINIKSLLFSIFIGILIVLFFYLDSKYKSISWYKSGKVGFAGLATLGIFFLAHSIIALVDPNMLSFMGKIDAISSSIASFLFFISLYNLSGL